MRTESLRELASFFVRFLRKGGAIVYAAVPRRAAAACALRGCPRQPYVVWAARARAGRSPPEAVAAVVCCGPRAGLTPRVAVAAPRAPPESKPSVSANLGAGCVCSGTLDFVGEMCLCGLVCGREICRGETRAPACVSIKNARVHAVYARHCLLLHAQSTLFNRATTGIDPSIELQLVQSLCNTHSVTPALQPQPNALQPWPNQSSSHCSSHQLRNHSSHRGP